MKLLLEKLILSAALLGATCLHAEDWPAFRGAGGVGVTAETNVPAEWSGDKNVAWKTKIPGRGWSSPIIFKDRVYLTSAATQQEGVPQPKGGGGRIPQTPVKFEVHCLELATGKKVWTELALESKPKIATHRDNTYATETPVIDDGRLYAYFAMHGLYCYDLDGKQLWKKDLGSFAMTNNWGTASSPAAAAGRVFVQIDNEEKSFLVALDGKTGKEEWRMDRAEKTGWATPIVWKNKSRTELVTIGAQKARSYDPATGKLLWELSLGGGRCSASPTSDDDRVYVGLDGAGGRKGGGKGGPGGGAEGGGTLFAVKAGATGDITPKTGEKTSAGVEWSQPKAGPQMASPLVYQGYLYVFARNGGIVSCYDAKTGKPAYDKERLPSAGAFWASPWAADGKVFCIDDAGTTHVLKAGPTFEVLGTNSLKDTTWASPAVANGTLVIRGTNSVYAIKK